jgi:hypothetical protein
MDVIVETPVVPRRLRPFDVTADTTVEMRQEMYVRQRLRGSSETFEMFVPSGWTGDMLIRHLLDRASRP